jgi:thiamine-phosphate pyrophosphorylase
VRGFYFITDQGLSLLGNEADVAAAACSGAACVQYRAKNLPSRAMYAEALRLKALAGTVPFVVNDRIDIALAVGADGIHLGQSDLPLAVARRLMGDRAIIGISVTEAGEARRAESEGATYLGVGPVFATATKADAARPIGLIGLKNIRGATRLPLVAIGGIDLDGARSCLAAGADMVAAIQATVARPDAAGAMSLFGGLF